MRRFRQSFETSIYSTYYGKEKKDFIMDVIVDYDYFPAERASYHPNSAYPGFEEYIEIMAIQKKDTGRAIDEDKLDPRILADIYGEALEHHRREYEDGLFAKAESLLDD